MAGDPKVVLVCDYVEHVLLNGLNDLGYKVIYSPEATNQQVSELIDELTGVIVNTRTKFDRDLMKAGKKLRFIGRLGVGLDIFDEQAAQDYGIKLINTPGANANAVGEHIFGMLLGLVRNIPAANTSVKSGYWLREKQRGRELRCMTVGIIGCGNTGKAFASKFANWETIVLSYDKYKEHYVDDLRFVRESSLEEVMELSDVISLHVPLTKETLGMVDSAFLTRCRNGVIIINSSRGKVIDTAALVEGLDSGKVGGACLDVLANEKLESLSAAEKNHFERLCEMDNVILTPHIAGWTFQSKRNIAQQMLNSLHEID